MGRIGVRSKHLILRPSTFWPQSNRDWIGFDESVALLRRSPIRRKVRRSFAAICFPSPRSSTWLHSWRAGPFRRAQPVANVKCLDLTPAFPRCAPQDRARVVLIATTTGQKSSETGLRCQYHRCLYVHSPKVLWAAHSRGGRVYLFEQQQTKLISIETRQTHPPKGDIRGCRDSGEADSHTGLWKYHRN